MSELTRVNSDHHDPENPYSTETSSHETNMDKCTKDQPSGPLEQPESSSSALSPPADDEIIPVEPSTSSKKDEIAPQDVKNQQEISQCKSSNQFAGQITPNLAHVMVWNDQTNFPELIDVIGSHVSQAGMSRLPNRAAKKAHPISSFKKYYLLSESSVTYSTIMKKYKNLPCSNASFTNNVDCLDKDETKDLQFILNEDDSLQKTRVASNVADLKHFLTAHTSAANDQMVDHSHLSMIINKLTPNLSSKTTSAGDKLANLFKDDFSRIYYNHTLLTRPTGRIEEEEINFSILSPLSPSFEVERGNTYQDGSSNVPSIANFDGVCIDPNQQDILAVRFNYIEDESAVNPDLMLKILARSAVHYLPVDYNNAAAMLSHIKPFYTQLHSTEHLHWTHYNQASADARTAGRCIHGDESQFWSPQAAADPLWYKHREIVILLHQNSRPKVAADYDPGFSKLLQFFESIRVTPKVFLISNKDTKRNGKYLNTLFTVLDNTLINSYYSTMIHSYPKKVKKTVTCEQLQNYQEKRITAEDLNAAKEACNIM